MSSEPENISPTSFTHNDRYNNLCDEDTLKPSEELEFDVHTNTSRDSQELNEFDEKEKEDISPRVESPKAPSTSRSTRTTPTNGFNNQINGSQKSAGNGRSSGNNAPDDNISIHNSNDFENLVEENTSGTIGSAGRNVVNQMGVIGSVSGSGGGNIRYRPPKKKTVDNCLLNVSKKLKKKKIPTTFYKDPEQMYMDNQELKAEIAKLKEENLRLKTTLHKTEIGQMRKQKQVEELLRAQAIVETNGNKYENLFKEVNMVKRLKIRVRDLEKALADKEEELNKLKLDSKHTRVRELETELKAYYTESRRLQKVVEQFQHGSKMNSPSSSHER